MSWDGFEPSTYWFSINRIYRWAIRTYFSVYKVPSFFVPWVIYFTWSFFRTICLSRLPTIIKDCGISRLPLFSKAIPPVYIMSHTQKERNYHPEGNRLHRVLKKRTNQVENFFYSRSPYVYPKISSANIFHILAWRTKRHLIIHLICNLVLMFIAKI